MFLSVVFRHKAPVVAIPLIFIFCQRFFISLMPQLIYLTPWGLPDLVKVLAKICEDVPRIRNPLHPPSFSAHL